MGLVFNEALSSMMNAFYVDFRKSNLQSDDKLVHGRDLGVVFETCQRLVANMNWPHMCCDLMVLINSLFQMEFNYKLIVYRSETFSKTSQSVAFIKQLIMTNRMCMMKFGQCILVTSHLLHISFCSFLPLT
jgi:hypothetical protein